ncbi:MAG: dUTP diphosphatase [Eggerthellaceae bacterium]|nr:dUTP diphosphatase [Eggerthellaceae bacterium]
MQINVKLMNGAPLPKHAKPGDAGMDLTSREDVSLEPGETKMVGTGVCVEIPEGFVGLVFPRSGLGSKGVNLSNCVGVIDSGYRGEIKAPLHNNHPTHAWFEDEEHWLKRFLPNSGGAMQVSRGDRVCQLVVVPFETCECIEVGELSESSRGESGFGSSGSN